MRLVFALALLLLGFPAQADMYPDASNAQTADAFRFGTGLYPQYAQAVSTTAATTSGSADIVVASAAGIRVGDVISAMSPVFATAGGTGAVWVTAISGNVVSLSVAATSSNPAAGVTFGLDRYAAGKTVLADVLGVKKGWFGAAALGHSTWVSKYWSGADYPSLVSVFAVSENSNQGGMFATRTSDNPASAWVIALGSLLVDDSTSGAVRSTWNNYWESDLTGSVVGAHIQTESSVNNVSWPSVAADPYSPTPLGLSENLRLDCGIGPATHSCSAALHITHNGAAYLSGIVIGQAAISPAAGLSPAVELATNHSIDWFSAVGNRAWRLYSVATGGNSYFALDNAGRIQVSGSTPHFQFNSAGSIGTVGLVDGVNTVLEAPSGGSVLLRNAGATKITLGSALMIFSDPVVGLRPQAYTVAALPACNAAAAYTVASVSDQNGAPTYRGALTGGGGLKVPVFCNGATWEAH